MKTLNTIVLLLVVLGLTASAPTPAEAIICNFVSVTGVSFGTYDVFSGSPLDSTGELTYRCTAVASDMITIDISTGISSSFYPRTLTQAAKSLNYNVYTDAARTNIWGDATGSTVHYGPLTPAEAVDVAVAIYGRIPAMQDSYAGSFADTIVVTINY